MSMPSQVFDYLNDFVDIQDLNKRPLLSGLGDVDFSFLRTSRRRPSRLGGNKQLCHCNRAQPESVHTIKYYGSTNQYLVLCMCRNAVMSARYMIDVMGKISYAIRQNNLAMISSSEGTCGGAGSNGDVSFYCHKTMHISVFIHESAHSFDQGKSVSQEWRDAVDRDSCVPDSYANRNHAEAFAQVVVLWVYLVDKGQDQDLGGSQFDCMKNQLRLMLTYLPAWSLL